MSFFILKLQYAQECLALYISLFQILHFGQQPWMFLAAVFLIFRERGEGEKERPQFWAIN